MATTKSETTPVNMAPDQKTITVVVVDSKSQPVNGARVSISPSGASGLTNTSGEFQFKTGTATKYDITASYNSNTVTVPYYVTQNGATRLVVNPVYVKNVEQKLHQSSFLGSAPVLTTGIVVSVIIAIFIVWRFFFKR